MNRTFATLRGALIALLALAAQIPAHAMLPESGWYWNPNESGRGFNLEIQDNALFLSAFVYRPDGSAAWYVGGGPMASDRSWTAELYETVGGQCIGCSYRSPTLLLTGSVSINFTSERSATISLLGGSVSVVRQDWSNSGATTHDALLGEWSTTEGEPSFPIFFGERISLYIQRSDSAGAYAGGHRTGDSGDTAVGDYYANSGNYSILLDSSTSYYSYFVFKKNGFNRIEGQQWTYLKSSLPTGSGLYFVGHRTKSYARLRGLNAPGVAKSAGRSPEREAIDAARAQRSLAKAGEPVPMEGVTIDEVREMAAKLQQRLEGARR
ncbi:MAG: hypothetical protein AB7P08_06725 [Burkholderiales bacterium]